MTKGARSNPSPLFLGIEGGGTRTVALLADDCGREISRREFGPANFKLLSHAQLVRHLRAIAAEFPRPQAIGIGLAGARGEAEWSQVRAAAARAWPGVPCHATHDLNTALAAANPQHSKLGTQNPELTRVLILSGTGSCCFGRGGDGRTARFGGWGHLLGDKGSGYEIGLRALRAAVFYLDRDGTWSRLGQRVLAALMLNEPGDLIPWAHSASKADIAALAAEVFAAANYPVGTADVTRSAGFQHGAKSSFVQRAVPEAGAPPGNDAIARDILRGAASSLAKDGIACARKLSKPGAPVQFILAGGVLTRQPRFAGRVASELRRLWPGARVTTLKREGAWGAVALARRALLDLRGPLSERRSPSAPLHAPLATRDASLQPDLSPTELRHPRSMQLDRLPLADAIELMLGEDERIPQALRVESAAIEQAVRRIAGSLKRGGRLFYVGAGTSGRLGVLDASECPPTFRTPPDLVQGVMAGGQQALWRAVEGAEDDAAAGERAMQFRGAGARDVVVGIAASGRTPFVRGALHEARRRGAFTILLCFNPAMKSRPRGGPHLVIAPALGPEVLTGSTRLKAGTATKLVLNIFTTLAMVRLGKVVGNLMVDVKPSNVKLRDRAVRIVRELTGADGDTARRALVRAGWVVKNACRLLRRRRKRAGR